MPQQLKRLLFVVIIVLIFIIVISIAFPILYSSTLYSGPIGNTDWTPMPTKTSTPTMIIVPPTIPPSATPQGPTTPTVALNCVYPTEYWLDHSELWPEQLIFGNETFYRDDIRLILRSASLDLHQTLLKFYYLSYLNIIAGADSAPIDDTLFQANNWLYTYPFGSQLTEDGYRFGVQLVQTLVDYNTGFLGLGLCPPYEVTTRTIVTIEPSISVTSESTPIATPFGTSTDIPTATPRRVTQRPTPIPTRTRNPTDKPPKPTKAPPTATPQPQNTSTPIPTVKPTNPPPTPIPTEAPTPTPVP